MAQFKNWRETNALVMVADLEVEEVPMVERKECGCWGELKFAYYNGFMKGYLPEGKVVDDILKEDFDDTWWDQFDIEQRAALKPTQGGFEEKDHPWSELRKFTLKGIETLQDAIQAGKDAEKMLARVKPNIPNLNKMVKQEQETEEAKLRWAVK